jgi:hypothetical protein
MFARWIGVAVYALAGLLTAAAADASPVMYQFSGTFAQPVDGSTQFSGTFGYDTNLPIYPGTSLDGSHAYYGSGTDTPITMTLNLGTSGTNPLGTMLPSANEVAITHNASNDGFNLNAAFQPATGPWNYATIGMVNDNTTQPGPFTSLNPPSTLSLSSFNLGTQLIINPSGIGSAPAIGTITSLSVVSPSTVPEPTTAVIFLAIGAGLMGRRTSRLPRR